MPYSEQDKKREYQRLWMQKRRASFFEGKACVACGSAEFLELDHVNPEEKTSHRIWSFSKKKQEEELKKCQILCKSCHLEKTRKWLKETRTQPIKHGTIHGYGKRKCRCEKCREARNEYRRKMKERLGRWV